MSTINISDERPGISVDMDGVICMPFLNRNAAISRTLSIPSLRDDDVREYRHPRTKLYHWAKMFWQSVRYAGRQPMRGAYEGLARLTEIRRPILVTGRSFFAKQIIQRWLERHALDQFFVDVMPNNTNLKTAQFKLWVARRLGHGEHVDDDGSVAHYLGSHGVHVFLHQRRWVGRRSRSCDSSGAIGPYLNSNPPWTNPNFGDDVRAMPSC